MARSIWQISTAASGAAPAGISVSNGFYNNGTVYIPETVNAVINGSYLQGDTGTLRYAAVSDSSYGKLVVNGTDFLPANAKIDVDVKGDFDFTNQRLDTVLAATTLVSPGTFAVTDNSYLYNFTAVKDGNLVHLVAALDPNPVDPNGGNGAENGGSENGGGENGGGTDATIENRGTVEKTVYENKSSYAVPVAKVVDGILTEKNTSTPDLVGLINFLGSLKTGAQVTEAVKQLVPSSPGAAASLTAANISNVGGLIGNRLDSHGNSNLGANGNHQGGAPLCIPATATPLERLAAGDMPVCPPETQPQSLVVGAISGTNIRDGALDGANLDPTKDVWIRSIGSTGSQAGDANGAPGYQARTWGVIGGADFTLSDNRTVLGGAVGFFRSRITSNNNYSRNNLSNLTFSGYGQYDLTDRQFLRGEVTGGALRNSASRSINFGTINRVASSNAKGYLVNADIAYGIRSTVNPKVQSTWEGHATYTRVAVNGYNETGAGGLNLNVKKSVTNAATLGLVNKLSMSPTDRSTFVLNTGFAYDFINKPSIVMSSFQDVPGRDFSTQGVIPGPWILNAGLHYVYQASRTVDLSAGYDLYARTGFTNQTISARLRKAF